MNVNVLRSESIGDIHIKSADPAEPPAINGSTSCLRRTTATACLAAMRKRRELMGTAARR